MLVLILKIISRNLTFSNNCFQTCVAVASAAESHSCIPVSHVRQGVDCHLPTGLGSVRICFLDTLTSPKILLHIKNYENHT